MKANLLLIGYTSAAEFQSALDWLVCFANVHRAATIGQAVEILAATRHGPDVIMFVQARPAIFSERDIELIHSAAPLARLVALLGSWCEGEIRTGHPWPGVARIYWHQFSLRACPEIEAISSGASASWMLPRTRTEMEHSILAAHHFKPALQSAPPDFGPRSTDVGPRVLIWAPDRVAFETWAIPLQDVGFDPSWLRPENSDVVANACMRPSSVRASFLSACHPTFGIWDGEFDMSVSNNRLKDFIQQVTPAPVFAILGFPRWGDRQEALELGVRECFSKPIDISNLIRALSNAVTPPGRI